MSPGQRSAAVVLVGRRADGLLHVELTEFRPGTSWLGGSLQELSGRLGVEAWHRGGRTPEATALASLPDGLRLAAMKAGDWPAACGSLGEVVDAGSLRHLGDPRWAAALAAVVRRDVGDGAWEMAWRGSQGDAAPVMALVAALHGLAANPSYDINDSIF